jgi:glycosyltransferase involved in cell wall biosynthesis
MKICLIGGIYGQRGTASGYLRTTPETTLETACRAAGCQVSTLSHYASADFSRFDVVHVHHLSYGAARVASDPSFTPFVFTAHDASQMSGAALGQARALALRYVVSRADRVVSLSDAEALFQRATHGIGEDRSATIPNGIDAARFPFRKRRPGPWQLLYVGQLIPLKGCDLILRAVAQLEQDVTLTLAYQTADLQASLEALCSSLGIAHKVRFIGKQEPGQLAALYEQSHLLVMASETEALPSVISEAMMSGLPFVSTAVGGIVEQAGGFGHLISRRAASELAAGITYALDHYERFEAQAEAMSRYAQSKYSVDAMLKRHLDLYRSVAGRRPRRLRRRYAAVNMLVRASVERLGTRRDHDDCPHRTTSSANSV